MARQAKDMSQLDDIGYCGNVGTYSGWMMHGILNKTYQIADNPIRSIALLDAGALSWALVYSFGENCASGSFICRAARTFVDDLPAVTPDALIMQCSRKKARMYRIIKEQMKIVDSNNDEIIFFRHIFEYLAWPSNECISNGMNVERIRQRVELPKDENDVMQSKLNGMTNEQVWMRLQNKLKLVKKELETADSWVEENDSGIHRLSSNLPLVVIGIMLVFNNVFLYV